MFGDITSFPYICSTLEQNFIRRASAWSNSVNYILCRQSSLQARTKCLQHSRSAVGKILNIADIVIQFLNWSALNPVKPVSILREIRPTLHGADILSTHFWLSPNLLQFSSPFCSQILIMCFPVPRNRLCIGSTVSIVGGSMYGKSSNIEYLQPNSDSFLALAVFVWHFKTSLTLLRCIWLVLGGQRDLSNPE